MRTSRLSRDTAKLVHALSSPTRRQTRSSTNGSALRSFAFPGPSQVSPDPDSAAATGHTPDVDDDLSSLSSAQTVDMEDIFEPPSKRLRRTIDTPITQGSAISSSPSPRSSREVIVKKEEDGEIFAAKSPILRKRRVPARKIKGEDGLVVKVEPPSDWETIYNTVKKMRAANPTAPVDTMGCAELYSRTSSPRDRRFQTLIALMLSSQTKDTVTAVAMQRLHTELGDDNATLSDGPSSSEVKKEDDDVDGIAPKKPVLDVKKSALTLENVLTVSPEKLNSLIRTVGFHNNKTKYIKAAAVMLRDQYNSDIPETAEELMKLPGVGPKMAYLCMSAAWGKDEGIGVDVHVHRITNLWGWHKTKTPEETRMALESWLPKDKWHEINKLLVGLGQTVCLPVGRRCEECDLAGTKLCKGEVRGSPSKRSQKTAVNVKVQVDETISQEVQVKTEVT